MTNAALAHPRLQTVQTWILGTEDAHGVYAKVGFSPLKYPDRYMQRPGKGVTAI